MTRWLRSILVSGLVLVLPCGDAYAQERYGMLVLELPASARAMALGDAFTVGAADADAIHYGPAFGSSLRGFSVGLARWSNEALALSLAGGGEWWGGALGGALQTLEYESVVVGYADPLEAEPLLGADAPVHVSERVASLVHARRIWELEVSLTAKLLEARVDDASARGYALDAAVGRAFGPVRLGLAARHLGPALDVGDGELTLPARATLSAATARAVPVGPLDIGAAAALSVREDGELLPGGGVELSYWPLPGRTFYARAGLRRAGEIGTPFTFGAGFTGDAIGLDWAYAPYDDAAAADGVHRLSVRLR